MTYSLEFATDGKWITPVGTCKTPKCRQEAAYYIKDEDLHLCKDCTEELLFEYWQYDKDNDCP